MTEELQMLAREMKLAGLVDASRWAHVVHTADGPAIEIAGQIINVRSSAPELHVDAIVRALRGQTVSGGSTDPAGTS